MLLMQTVQDNTMAVSGFEHQTFMCSSCHDVERRLVFAKQDEQTGGAASVGTPAQTVAAGQSSAEPVAQFTAPSISPAPTLAAVASDQIERAGATGVLRRVFARLRGG
jgi:hypothetical protein